MGILANHRIKELQKAGFDLDFLKQIQPQGNINFKYDRFYYGGDGYYTVLHLYQYPSEGLSNFWLHDIMQISGTRSFLSLYHLDSNEIQKQISKAIGEKESRLSNRAKYTDNQRELDEIQDMANLYREINKMNVAMVGFYVRIFMTASTEDDLFKKIDEIKDKLSRYKMTILIGELDYEYLAPFVPPSEQIKLPNKRRGTVTRARDIAGGYFFNHTKLEDKHGSYFGYTPTDGAINFNFLERDSARTRSFMFISGNPGMGQTLFSLRVNDDLYAKGHFIRNFDSSGTFTTQTKHQQGLILDLSGSQNRINPFQVFPTVTNAAGSEVDEIRSFQLHVEKLTNMFQMLNEKANGDDLQAFKKLVTNFYIDRHIWYRNPKLHLHELRATKIRKEEYPILSDFVNYLNDAERKLTQLRTVSNMLLASVTRIKQTFEGMLQTHAGIFEGVTEFQDITSEPVVTFDFSALKGQPSIYNAQVFSVLSLISADVTNNGKQNKSLLRANPNLEEADLRHYVVNIADAQQLISPKYQRSVDLLADIIDSMGENYAGIILSVKSLQGILFETGTTSMSDPYAIAVKRIFGLMQYRVFAQTAETDIPLLANALAGSMNKSELETLPKLRQKQLFMNIAGVGNLVFTQQLMGSENQRYGNFLSEVE